MRCLKSNDNKETGPFRARELSVELRLFEASPAWAIDEDTIVGYDLSFTQGLRLFGVDTTCGTDDALEDLSTRLNDVLCRVTARSTLRQPCNRVSMFLRLYISSTLFVRVSSAGT